ncbi:unnamed protein product [Symbiodinium natans]|uniref:RING-type domain-containing protein n=1 Tax=Symbiodinium natans TaxID=878477 RepID=A0A812GX80_9DINO|nr:unnamed protein product [Symbiodinium natans]
MALISYHYEETGPPAGQLDGVWLNADCPWEEYTVTGQRVRRSNSQGIREFSIQWDPARLSWQWGRHGRLSMQWLGVDSIAWVPDMSCEHHNGRVWRWRRVQPSTPPVNTLHAQAHRDTRVTTMTHHARDVHRPPREQRRPSRSRSRGRHWHSHGRHSHGRYRSRRNFTDAQLPCGLTHREVYSLLSREITPEDYEMLLRLDEFVPKGKVATEEETNEALQTIPVHEVLGKECPICLAPFKEAESVAAVPCSHTFHKDCISTWLSNYRRTCPLCCTELERA